MNQSELTNRWLASNEIYEGVIAALLERRDWASLVATLPGASEAPYCEDLRGICLEKLLLERIDLHYVWMDYAMFNECNMSACSVQGARLPYATFSTCELAGSDMLGVMGCNVVFDRCDLSEIRAMASDLRDAKIVNCSLNGAALSGVKMRGATLTDCDLTRADLSYSDLSNADFRGSILAGVRIEGAILDGAKGLE